MDFCLQLVVLSRGSFSVGLIDQSLKLIRQIPDFFLERIISFAILGELLELRPELLLDRNRPVERGQCLAIDQVVRFSFARGEIPLLDRCLHLLELGLLELPCRFPRQLIRLGLLDLGSELLRAMGFGEFEKHLEFRLCRLDRKLRFAQLEPAR